MLFWKRNSVTYIIVGRGLDIVYWFGYREVLFILTSPWQDVEQNVFTLAYRLMKRERILKSLIDAYCILETVQTITRLFPLGSLRVSFVCFLRHDKNLNNGITLPQIRLHGTPCNPISNMSIHAK